MRSRLRTPLGLFTVLLGVLGAACAGVPGAGLFDRDDDGRRARAERDATPAASEDASARVTELGPRELAPGECGLFLWSRAAEPRLVFFSNPATRTGAIAIDGRERALRRIDVTTSAEGGRYGDQLFATEAGDISVSLTINESETIEGGARVGRATLRVSGTDEWSTVLSAGGLAGCQS